MTRSHWLSLGVALSAFVVGAGGGWWLNKPKPPWLEITVHSATYTRGIWQVEVAGEYTARKTCSRESENTSPEAPDPLRWLQEVQGTGPQVAILAPAPPAPELRLGTHAFKLSIPLEEGIEPDGWQVAALVSCDTDAIRSRSVEVEYLPRQQPE